jgi:hypothetical protein
VESCGERSAAPEAGEVLWKTEWFSTYLSRSPKARFIAVSWPSAELVHNPNKPYDY